MATEEVNGREKQGDAQQGAYGPKAVAGPLQHQHASEDRRHQSIDKHQALGRRGAGGGTRELHDPFNEQQQAGKQGEAHLTGHRVEQDPEATDSVEHARQGAKNLAATIAGAANPEDLGDAGGDRHPPNGQGQHGG